MSEKKTLKPLPEGNPTLESLLLSGAEIKLHNGVIMRLDPKTLSRYQTINKDYVLMEFPVSKTGLKIALNLAKAHK